MEASVVTAEVIEVSEPVRDVETKELSPTAEKIAQAERCATNFGAVAIVCVGCSMLEMCRLRNEAMQLAQEQLVAVEGADEYSLTNDSTILAQSSIIIESETLSVTSNEVGIATPAQPEKDRTPKKPSYLERLLDDNVEVVLADSIMDAGEAPTRSDTSVRQGEELLPAKETNGDVSSDSIKAIPVSESLPIDDEKVVSDSAEMAVAVETEVEEVEVMTAVALNEPERSNVEILDFKGEEVPETIIVQGEEVLVVSSDSEALVVRADPVVEAVIDIVPTSIAEVVLTAPSTDIIVTKTTITEVVSQTVRSEPLQISDYNEELTMPKEVLCEASDTIIEDDKPAVFAQIEELSVTSISAEAIIDALPVELESKVTENHSDAPFEEQQVVSEFDDTLQARRRYKVLEIDEIGIQDDILAKSMIDGDDTIDPEFRLSDTTVIRHLTIGMLRRLALQALRGLLLEDHLLLYIV